MTSAPALLAAALAAITAAALLPGIASGPAERDDGLLAAGHPRVLLVAGAVGAGLLAWSFLSVTTFVLTLILATTALAVSGMVRRRRAAVAAEGRSDQVLAVCEALASDLAAGQPPLVSLERAAAEWPEFAPVAVAGRLGADVPGALRELAEQPGGGQLRTLAASWAVAHRTGAGLSLAIDRAADSIRGERRTARLVAAELSAARATARMLAVLPVGVLVLGSGIGGDPVGFLIGTPVGLGCLAGGLGLSLTGMRWLEGIAGRVLHR